MSASEADPIKAIERPHTRLCPREDCRTEVEEAIEQRDHFRDLAVTECNRWNEATKERDALRAAIDEVLDEQIAALVHESAKEIEAER